MSNRRTTTSKVRFLHGIDVLSVPTTYREPKGLYVLEALANGVPVVQPRHGSFPELIEATGGGLLVNPDDPHDLARALRQLFDDPGSPRRAGPQGQGSGAWPLPRRPHGRGDGGDLCPICELILVSRDGQRRVSAPLAHRG